MLARCIQIMVEFNAADEDREALFVLCLCTVTALVLKPAMATILRLT